MSAEVLRRAATHLRLHADHAIQGKWLSLEGGDRLIAVLPDDDFEYLVTEEPARDGSTADYIALMHPPVALALAEMMDRLAKVRDHTDGILADLAETLARAILREPS